MTILRMLDLAKKIMRKLLLLDADIVLDLHSLDLFGKISKTYDICLTRTVLEEAKYYKKSGAKIKIDLKDAAITIIDDIDLEIIKGVYRQAKEARLGIDPGESTSIAYLIQAEDDITFCTCDQAAIKLISYMDLDNKAISLEKALRSTGYRVKDLYPRHLEKTYNSAIREGKSLRIQFKKLT